ncbi:MAG: cation:proton antiporter [Candidatus Nanohaloarchaea archaeon]
MELFLLLASAYLFTLALGVLLEKIRVPWIFAALIFGLVLAATGFFRPALGSGTFEFLARLGMYFFLFVIGFEINVDEILEKSGFILKTTFIVMFLETVMGGVFVHYAFGTGWIVALFVAHIFATVGEAVLLPILEEFELVDTELGQTILGVATVDDTFEILSILLLPFIIGGAAASHFNWGLALLSAATLFAVTYAVWKVDFTVEDLASLTSGAFFLLMLFFLVLFIYIGGFAEAAALGALFAGIVSNSLVPEAREDIARREVKAVTYGLFGPLFFLWVGSDVTISIPQGLSAGFLGLPPWTIFAGLVVGYLVVVNTAKIGGTVIAGWNRLSLQQSLVTGVSLAVKFSTSIVIIKILFEKAAIGAALYSVLIASKIVFEFIIPFMLSALFNRWDVQKTISS